MYGECPSGDAGHGKETEGLQKGGAREACGVDKDEQRPTTGFSLFVDLCFPRGHRSFSLLPFGNFQ